MREGVAAASEPWGHYRAEKATSQRTQLLLRPADNLDGTRVRRTDAAGNGSVMFAGLHSSLALPLVGWMCLLAVVMLFERLRSRHLLRRMWRGIAELDDDKAEDVPNRLYPMFNAPQTALATVVIHQRAWSQGLLRGWKEEGDRTVSTRSFVLRLDDGRRVAVQTDSVDVRVACELEPASPVLAADNTERWRRGGLRYGDRLLVDGELIAAAGVESEISPYRNGKRSTDGALRPHRGRPLWLMSENALKREARSQLVLHLVFLALAMASLIAIRATTPFVAALFPRDHDPWIGFAWLALGAPQIAWLYCWRRVRPWYRRHPFNEH